MATAQPDPPGPQTAKEPHRMNFPEYRAAMKMAYDKHNKEVQQAASQYQNKVAELAEELGAELNRLDSQFFEEQPKAMLEENIVVARGGRGGGGVGRPRDRDFEYGSEPR